MPTEQKCPQCATPLPPGALEGLCPACLLKEGATEDTATQASSAPFQPPSVEEVARLFPQLQVLELIGKGGMGAVYKARQRALDRVVALKILPPQAGRGPDFAERFNREARALAKLSHPNIVAVHEFGQVDGMPFFIMEFVDGLNLRQLERAGRLAPREALQIVPQICEALQFAHDEGIVHRDIKPENILLDKKGRVKIADFGIAKIMGAEGRAGSPLPAAESPAEEGAHGVTRPTAALTEQAIGTPNYMAPEQKEQPQSVDHRADIFSLGVVFYEMLTGELPVGKFAPPSRRVEVDVRLDEVVLRALEKEPERRYQRASQVKTVVETIATAIDKSKVPRPFGGTGVDAHRVHDTRSIVMLGVLVGLVVFLATAALFTFLAFSQPKSYAGIVRIKTTLAPGDPYALRSELEVIETPEVLNKVGDSLQLPQRWARSSTEPLPMVVVRENLRRSLSFRPIRNTDLFEITYRDASSPDAAEIANRIADVYCATRSGTRPVIVDRAVPSDRPIGPNLPLNFAICIVLGILVGLGTGAFVGILNYQKRGQAARRLAGDTTEPFAVQASVSADHQGFDLNYRSNAMLFGLPVLHIATGIDPETRKPRVAKGFIAIGAIAKGVFAFGGVAMGIVAFGGVALGGLAFGGFALGAIALGGGAVGLLSYGGLAIALIAAFGGGAIAPIAVGGGAIGYYAFGGGALGVHVLDAMTKDPAAQDFFLPWADNLVRHINSINVAVMVTIMVIGLGVPAWACTWVYYRKLRVDAPRPQAPQLTPLTSTALFLAGMSGVLGITAFCLLPHPPAVLVWAIPVFALGGIVLAIPVRDSPPGRRALTIGCVNAAIWAIVATICLFINLHGMNSQKAMGNPPVLSPWELKSLPVNAVAEAGLSHPEVPWPWQELRDRTKAGQIDPAEAARIVESLAAWFRRDYPQGYSQPLFSIGELLNEFDSRKLIPETNILSFLDAYFGSPRLEPLPRVRETNRALSIVCHWATPWANNLFGFQMLNAMSSLSIDGQPVSATGRFAPGWSEQEYRRDVSLPELAPGKHVLRCEVESALVPVEDMPGLAKNAPPTDWPLGRKRWTRTCQAEFTVYAKNAEIVHLTNDPALNPASSGAVAISQVFIRPRNGRLAASIDMQRKAVLNSPLSADVTLRIGGQILKCGSVMDVEIARGKSQGSYSDFTVEIGSLDKGIKDCDVVLTPNAHLVEPITGIDRLWSEEIVFRNVPLVRQDLAGAGSGSTGNASVDDRAPAGIAANLTTNFYIGQAYFPNGDSIEITSVDRTAGRMVVKGRYNLVSHERASLQLHITASADNANFPQSAKQSLSIIKGRGSFELTHPHVVPGMPHVVMYSPGGEGFADLYFGTKAEADRESKLDLGPGETNSAAASAEKWSPTLAPGEKLGLSDVQKVRDEVKTLMDQNHYEDALQRQIWYFNHAVEYGEINPIRLSFGIMNWNELGRRYPKAKQALTEIRDHDVREVLEGRGYSQLFSEIQSLNGQLQDDGATLALFKTIRQQDKPLASQCYPFVELMLMQAGEYELCLECIGDPQARFESFRSSLQAQRENQQRMDEIRKQYPTPVPPLRSPPDMGQMATNYFVGQVCKLIEILVATKHNTEAEKIQDQAVAVVDDPRLKSAVSDAEKKIRK